MDMAVSVLQYFCRFNFVLGRQIAEFLEESLERNIAEELKVEDDASVLDRIAR
jgi:hypothetical protein